MMVDEYRAMKEKGMTDKRIMKEWDIDHNRLHRFKQKNGLIGKYVSHKGARSNKYGKALPKTTSAETPVTANEKEFMDKYSIKIPNPTTLGLQITEHDPVTSPSHYTAGGIETIDYMKAKLTQEQFQGYLTGNVMKYISRYGHKNGIEDIKKARWYMDKLIEDMEAVT